MKQLVLLVLLGISPLIHAQIYPYQHHTERERDKSDTSSLQAFFRNGEFYGHARYYFMATDNEKKLSDYYANAFGMGIGYETGKFQGFQIGISGFFIYNLLSSDLTKADPATGQLSRYETGQFDLLNPGNKHDMDRLEDLYLKYSYKKSNIKLGKQHIRTPFINPQDGRMRPTLAEGAIFEINEIRNLKIEGGWLFGVSPRGTVSWFGIGQSIGVFSTGVNPDGSKSGYHGNITSDGLYYIGITKQIGKGGKIQLWNQYIDNVQNSTMLQVNHDMKLNDQYKLIYGIQYIEQHAIHNGGNADEKKTLVEKGSTARTAGGRLGLSKTNNWLIAVNYNRIFNEGRYIMPREWGRDPFFTFMSRERNEGMADVHAINGTINKTFAKTGWKAEIGYGHFYMPDVKNTADNKYGMPSYFQANADVRYLFKNFFKGLEMQFLYVYKGKLGETYNNDKYVINKVNMSLYNLVLNYHF